MSITLPDPGPLNLEFERPADRARLDRTAAALNGRGFKAQVADNAEHARRLVLDAIPAGAEVHTYAGGNVILVIGHQKLVHDLDEALRRLRQYSLPREFARMQDAGFPGTMLAKTLIIHYEPSARITVILVPEKLGF
jgi:hypothetical protein